MAPWLFGKSPKLLKPWIIVCILFSIGQKNPFLKTMLIPIMNSLRTTNIVNQLATNNSLQINRLQPWKKNYNAHATWTSIGIVNLYCVFYFWIKGFKWQYQTNSASSYEKIWTNVCNHTIWRRRLKTMLLTLVHPMSKLCAK